MNIRKFLSIPENVTAYQEWLNHPITRIMRESSLEMSKPLPLTPPDPNAGLYQHGIHIGYHLLMDFVFGADRLIESLNNNEKVDAAAPDYGAREMLKRGEAV